jgi:hypothetical protein
MKLSLLCSIGLLMAAPLTAQTGQDPVQQALELLQQSQVEAAAGNAAAAAELAAKAQALLSEQSQKVQVTSEGLVLRQIDRGNDTIELQVVTDCEEDREEDCEECEDSEDCDTIIDCDDDFDIDFEFECEETPGGDVGMWMIAPHEIAGPDLHRELQALNMELQALRLELQSLRSSLAGMHGMQGMMMPQMRMRMPMPPMPQLHGMMMPGLHDIRQQLDMDWDDMDWEGMDLNDIRFDGQPQIHSELKVIINGEVFEGDAAREKLQEMGMEMHGFGGPDGMLQMHFGGPMQGYRPGPQAEEHDHEDL